MHGDFSLNPLAYRDAVSRVLLQQGRVTLDSDANEQTESVLRFLRGLAFDVVGAHGGVGDAFELVPAAPGNPDLLIRWGSYYVDGIRCVNVPDDFDVLAAATGADKIADGRSVKAQRGWLPPTDGDTGAGSKDLLFFLDVFERHISAAEDDSLREVALLGPDTASRAVVVWQVRTMAADPFLATLQKITDAKALPSGWEKTWDLPYLALNLMLQSGVRMRARALVNESTDPCAISPEARYRGSENRLYRVEIHDAGVPGTATFKWSADNGSIVYPIRDEVNGQTVHLESLGRDDRTTIRVNDWVEVVDDRVVLTRTANPLLQVIDVRPQDMTVTLSAAPSNNAGGDRNLHPILRRWESAPVALREGEDRDAWLGLKDGVAVQFSHNALPFAHYRTGDYWLVPTRTATGDVQWPRETNPPHRPLALPPHGIAHHYAPLAKVTHDLKTVVTNYRRHFEAAAHA